MRPHDLLFAACCVAAVAHVSWVAGRGGLLDGGVQTPQQDPQAYADDAARLHQALAELPAAGGAAGAPDVLLITLSGARADRLPVPGGALEAWGAEALRFTALRGAAPYAEAALGSLATGALPSEHGAVRTRVGAQRPLDPGRPTLAERLSEAGYLSLSVSAQRAVGELQLDRGFQVGLDGALSTRDVNLPYLPADRVTELGLEALRARGERPVFLQLNYADAELPWLLRDGHCADTVPFPEVLPPGGALLRRPDWRRVSRAVVSGERAARPKELETWSIAYDSELCYLDAQLGRLLSEGAGLGPEDWVVVVSLYGAGLGEAGALGSGRSVAEDLLASSLWVRGPGVAPGTDARPLSLDALPDLLLSWLGLEALPPQALPAPPGLRVAELHGPSAEDAKAATRGQRWTSQRALREGERVFVVRGDKRHALWRSEGGTWVEVLEDAGALREAALAWTAQADTPGGVK